MKPIYVFAAVLLLALLSLGFTEGCKRDQEVFSDNVKVHPFTPLTFNGHNYLKYTEASSGAYLTSVVHDPDCPCNYYPCKFYTIQKH